MHKTVFGRIYGQPFLFDKFAQDIRQESGYKYFPNPAKDLTKYFWKIKNTIRTGKIAIVSPAIIDGQSDDHSPLSFINPNGKVFTSSDVNIIKASRNSFQIHTV